MNRQDFYLNLALELNNLKVPPELINTHIDQFKQYLQTLSEADAEKQIASFGDVRSLAANIYRLLCGGDDAPAPAQKTPAEPAGETVYDAFRVEEEEDIVDLLEDTSIATDKTTDIESIDDAPPAPAQVHKRAKKEFLPKTDATVEIPMTPAPVGSVEDETDGEQMALDFGAMAQDGYIAPDPTAFGDKPSDSDTIIIDAPILPPEGRAYYKPEEVEDEDEPFTEFTFDDLPKRKERSTGGLILFYFLFILTLPITLALFAVSMTLFGVAYILFGFLTGASFALIFLGSVLGATMALSGGVYSVLQFNSGATAIGLFELGLSLVIIGITVFATFLFTMLSFRWLPALLRYLTTFMRFYLNKLICLFKYLKGRCEQL